MPTTTMQDGTVPWLICLGVCAVDCIELVELPPIYALCVSTCVTVCMVMGPGGGGGTPAPVLG
jgi:hypothetical protein